MIFATGVAGWALAAVHVPTLGEFYLLRMGLNAAACQAGAVGLMYLALEPFVRRIWPEALISWMRLVSGRFRDPLVASHVLVGISAGLAFILLRMLTAWGTGTLLGAPGNGASVGNARFLTSNLLLDLWLCAFLSVGYVLVLVMMRRVARRTWVADALFVVLLSALLAPLASADGATYLAVGPWILWFAAITWVLRRFGLLAVAAAVYASYLTMGLPLPVASSYAAVSLATPLLIAAVAAWSLYAVLASRPGTASRSAAEPLV